MMPSLIYELLSSDSNLIDMGVDGVYESQSLDSRPPGICFITVNFEESDLFIPIKHGPRNTTIAVHIPWDVSRDYTGVTQVLGEITNILTDIDCQKGNDDVLVSQVRLRGLSGNLTDEGYRTITRTATYGVSYQESSV